MEDIFVEDTPVKSAPKARKTKKETSQEEYLKVCERMAELRAKRKQKPGSEPVKKSEPEPEKPIKQSKSKPEVRYKEVIKYVDRPVEVIKEVPVSSKEPSKETKKYNLFDDSEIHELKSELGEVKTILSEMKQRKAEKDKNKAEKQQQQSEPSKPEPTKQETTKSVETPKQPIQQPKQTKIIYPPLFRPF